MTSLRKKDLPKKKRLKLFADQLWSKAVKDDWGYKCAICGKRDRDSLNSHHLVNRAHYATRYDLRNGICLCRYCHVFCPTYSPHLNGNAFRIYLARKYPHVVEWMDENSFPKLDGNADEWFLFEQILTLADYFEPMDVEQVTGPRFAKLIREQLSERENDDHGTDA